MFDCYKQIIIAGKGDGLKVGTAFTKQTIYPPKYEACNGGISVRKKVSSYACESCCRILDTLNTLPDLLQ